MLERGVPFAFYPGARAWHQIDTRLTTTLRGARKIGRAEVHLATKHPHVKGRLTLASFVAPNGGIARRHRLAYQLAEGGERLTRLGLRALDLLEALKLGRAWARLVERLWMLAYVRGVKDALPSRTEFQAFVASIPRDDAGLTLTVSLDEPAPLRLPSRQAPMEISVARDGAPIARTPATEPGEQWSWAALSARVVDAACRPPGDDLRPIGPALDENDREPAG